MHILSVTFYLAVATFLHTVTVALGKQCLHSSFNEVFYTCPNSQYCCGQESCCPNDYYYSVYDLWYFWFCLCFGIFICSLASGAYYRKRQLSEVQVAAIHSRNHPGHVGNVQLIHGHGPVLAGPGTGGLVHPPPRNLMVTTTAASGQPIYPPQGYYNEVPTAYPMYSTLGGPMYPAYAYMPPPPSYSSLGTDATMTPPSSTSPTASSSSSSSATSGSEVAPVST